MYAYPVCLLGNSPLYTDDDGEDDVCTPLSMQWRSGEGEGKRYCIAVMPFMEVFRDTATECYLPYGITQCYLLPDTSEHTPP